MKTNNESNMRLVLRNTYLDPFHDQQTFELASRLKIGRGVLVRKLITFALNREEDFVLAFKSSEEFS